MAAQQAGQGRAFYRDKLRNEPTEKARQREKTEIQNGGALWCGFADKTDLTTMPLDADIQTAEDRKALIEDINEARRVGAIEIDEQETNRAQDAGYLGPEQVLLKTPITKYSELLTSSFTAGLVRGLLLIEPEPAFAYLPLSLVGSFVHCFEIV